MDHNTEKKKEMLPGSTSMPNMKIFPFCIPARLPLLLPRIFCNHIMFTNYQREVTPIECVLTPAIVVKIVDLELTASPPLK